jgi:hypothetical protein
MAYYCDMYKKQVRHFIYKRNFEALSSNLIVVEKL